MTLPAQAIVERLREPEFVTTDTGRLAADLVESQAATISRLTADNEALGSALEAERAAMDVTQRRAQTAETRVTALEAYVRRLKAALEPFATYLDKAKFDLDNKGRPLPDGQGMGWVYLTVGNFRRARAALGGFDHG